MRAGDRGARGLRRRHPLRAEGRARSQERRRDGHRHHGDGGDGSRATRCWWRSGARRRRQALGLEDGRASRRPAVAVDARMQVPGHPWLYAIGDINGRALFTHMGKYQARIAADHILGHDTAISHGADGPLSPRVIFTEPQVGGGRPHDRHGGRRRPGRRRRGDVDVGQRRRIVLRPQRARHLAAADRPRAPGRGRRDDHGRRGRASCCTRRRSRSSARFRWTASATPSPVSRRAARSGCRCWQRRASDPLNENDTKEAA